MTNPNTLRELLARATPFLRDEAAKYDDDGSNEPLELAREIEEALATPQPAPGVRMSGYMAKQWLSELMGDHDFTLPADAYEEIVAALAAQPAQDYKESKDCKVSAARDHVLRAHSAGLAIDAMDLDDPLGGWFDANTLEPTRNGEFLWDRFEYRVHPSPAQPASDRLAQLEEQAEKARALVEKWRTRIPTNAPDSPRVLMREHCADELAAIYKDPSR